MVLVPSQPVFLGGKTRRLATFLVGQAVNEQFFNLVRGFTVSPPPQPPTYLSRFLDGKRVETNAQRVRFSVPFTVSDWQLEFTLCSLRQYLQCNGECKLCETMPSASTLTSCISNVSAHYSIPQY